MADDADLEHIYKKVLRLERALRALADLHVCDMVKSPSDYCPICAMINEVSDAR